METIVLGGGCFWCTEAIFKRVKGVQAVTSGYAGGDLPNPSYEQLHDLDTHHAEVVRIEFDKQIISLEKILEIFWHIHDPTTPNRQGNDIGEQYRSIILYGDEEQKVAIENSIESIAKQLWDKPITTEVKPLDVFYKAEDYHQDYFEKNPAAGYCQLIINPKVAKFESKFKDLLKNS